MIGAGSLLSGKIQAYYRPGITHVHIGALLRFVGATGTGATPPIVPTV